MMKRIKENTILLTILFLIVARLFVPGRWFGCIVIGGFLVTLLDLIRMIYTDNNNLKLDNQKIRYGIIYFVLSTMFYAGVISIILNIIMEIKWLNAPIFLDELTLITLLLSLSQKFIVNKINKVIRKG